jgi:MFS family permease
MGTYQASASLARVIGPFVSGLLFATFGRNAPFLISAAVTLPAAWFVLGRAALPAADEALERSG